MNKPLMVFLLTIIPIFTIACGQEGLHRSAIPLFSNSRMLKPGDEIDTMVITTGAQEAAPLWAFCSPTVQNDHLITIDCGEVSFSRLAIGHTFGLMNLTPKGLDWSELKWEFYLDDYPVDLSAFGTYSFIHPDLAINPSPNKEVFRSATVWDIVLENSVPGAHVIFGHAQSGVETYTWIVNFTVPTDDNLIELHIASYVMVSSEGG